MHIESTPMPAPGGGFFSRSIVLHGLPLLLAVLAFAPGLFGDFVLDDVLAIVRNPVVAGDLPWYEAFSRSFWGEPLTAAAPSYRPIASLSFVLDRSLFGPSPLAFHLSSLFYYLLTIHVGQRVARVWLAAGPACLAACLFAVLPVHAENVSSLVGRADTLALFFSLLSLWAIAPAFVGQRASIGRTALAAVALLAAILNKESAVMLPFAALALALGRRTDPGGATRVRRAIAPLVLCALAVGYVVLRALAFPQGLGGYHMPDDVLATATVHQRLWHSLELVARYAGMTTLPVDLCTGRKFAEIALPADLPGLLPLAGALLVGLAAWRTIRDFRRGTPLFILASLLMYATFSSLLFSVPEAMADRFLLSPTWFLAMAAATPLCAWQARSRLAGGLVAFWLVAMTGASAFYATRWSDDLTLLRHSVTACPSSVHNHYRLGNAYAKRGAPAQAAWHFAVAAEGRRHFPSPWRHPAADVELELPIASRLPRVHELLKVELPEPLWRSGIERFLASEGQDAAAAALRASAASGRR